MIQLFSLMKYGDPGNGERLTDLTAVTYGFGIFLGNSKFKFIKYKNRSRTQSLGYLPEQVIGYTMAYLSFLRKEKTEYKKFLNKSMLKIFNQSINYLETRKPKLKNKNSIPEQSYLKMRDHVLYSTPAELKINVYDMYKVYGLVVDIYDITIFASLNGSISVFFKNAKLIKSENCKNINEKVKKITQIKKNSKQNKSCEFTGRG